MRDTPRIKHVAFTPARELDVSLGLLGYVACTIDAIRFDSIVLRQTIHGRLDLRFPTTRKPGGREFQVARPANEPARKAIESQILDALGRQGVGTLRETQPQALINSAIAASAPARRKNHGS